MQESHVSEKSAVNVSSIEGYAAWALQYDHQDNPLVAMAAHAMKHREAPIPDARVLELGCGTGRNFEHLRTLGIGKYVGIDNSRAMLDIARKRAGARPDARFIEARITESLPLDLGHFDLLLFSLVLEHIPAVQPALQVAAERARPGAQLLIYELHPLLHARGTRAHIERDGQSIHLPSYEHTEEEFVEALRASGWELDSVTSWYANRDACQSSRKLEKHLYQPVLLEVVARRA